MSDGSNLKILAPFDSGLNTALIEHAVKELVAEGFGNLMQLGELSQNEPQGPLLIIDGDSQRLMYKKVQELSFAPEFHLVVTDLGIETDENTGYNAEDLQLLKDGIQAECTPVGDATPQMNCPCCGWNKF